MEGALLWLARTLGAFVLTRGLGIAVERLVKRPPKPVGLRFDVPSFISPPREPHLEWEKATVRPPVDVTGATLELRVNGNDPPMVMRWDQWIDRQDLDKDKEYIVPMVVRTVQPGGYDLLRGQGITCHIDFNKTYITNQVMLKAFDHGKPLDPGDYTLDLTVQYKPGLRESHAYRLHVPTSPGEKLRFYA